VRCVQNVNGISLGTAVVNPRFYHRQQGPLNDNRNLFFRCEKCAKQNPY
jgi:hypothetical protein